MRVEETPLPGVLLLTPRRLEDARGFFFESYNARAFAAATSVAADFVQDNHSMSRRGVLRGLHYQLPPAGQAKLVRVVAGEIFDVVLDVRRGSTTFGRWFGTTLSAASGVQLWVPEGFAHGFLALSDMAECLYKTTRFYEPEHERCIAWNDPHVAIDWPLRGEPSLSPKDMAAPPLAQAEVFP